MGARTYTSRPNPSAWRKAFLMSRLQTYHCFRAPRDINCECEALRITGPPKSTSPSRISGSWYSLCHQARLNRLLAIHLYPGRHLASVNHILGLGAHLHRRIDFKLLRRILFPLLRLQRRVRVRPFFPLRGSLSRNSVAFFSNRRRRHRSHRQQQMAPRIPPRLLSPPEMGIPKCHHSACSSTTSFSAT